MKFALVSNVLPPSETAHAAILHRLLRDVDPASYVLLSSRDYSGGGADPDYSGRLSAPYYRLPPAFRLRRSFRLGRHTAEAIGTALGIPARARAIAAILRRERCNAVVVCTGGNEILDFPAAYLASRVAGARFYAYLLDQYAHMVSYVLGKSFLRRIEPMVMKGADAVIVPNEFLADEVRRRFGVEPVVIHNPCDLAAYEAAPAGAAADPAARGETRIVYTGGVGPLHFGAFRNLLAALGMLGRDDVRLHLYTAQPQAELDAGGIRGPVVRHPHQPVAAMPGIQRAADVLFLPLALDSAYPEIVRTAAPGKMGEFLAARRPILVHAPADSFLAWYFRRHGCGVVVDRNDPEEVARALDRLLHDPALRERLAERAYRRARADFSLADARARFAHTLGLDLRPGAAPPAQAV
jgi:glycosyltransferase involved in cell wall biosynthesis